jgi:hypothetical protein
LDDEVLGLNGGEGLDRAVHVGGAHDLDSEVLGVVLALGKEPLPTMGAKRVIDEVEHPLGPTIDSLHLPALGGDLLSERNSKGVGSAQGENEEEEAGHGGRGGLPKGTRRRELLGLF